MSFFSCLLINSFIIAYLAFAWSWNLPKDRLAKRLIDRLASIIEFLGLSHSWSMFAPNPIQMNRKLAARVRLNDGELIEWAAPDFGELGKVNKFLRTRERKFLENVVSAKHTSARPALCEYLDSKQRALGRKPVKIELIALKQVIPSPDRVDPPGEFQSTVIYTYGETSA